MPPPFDLPPPGKRKQVVRDTNFVGPYVSISWVCAGIRPCVWLACDMPLRDPSTVVTGAQFLFPSSFPLYVAFSLLCQPCPHRTFCLCCCTSFSPFSRFFWLKFQWDLGCRVLGSNRALLPGRSAVWLAGCSALFRRNRKNTVKKRLPRPQDQPDRGKLSG